MATVGSCALVGRHAPPCLAVVRPWASPVAFSSSLRRKSRPLSVACAVSDKRDHHRPALDIPPFALVAAVSPVGEEDWGVKEDKNEVKLWCLVPGLSKEDLEVKVDMDVLVIKTKFSEKPPADGHGVGAFKARVLMTERYEREQVKAELKAGVLEVTIGKKTTGEPRDVPVEVK